MGNPFDFFHNKATQSELESRKIHLRTGVLAGLFCGILLIFGGVLYNLQIVRGQDYLEHATITTVQTETVKTARGDILDRNGNVLVSSKLTYNVTLSPSRMGPDRNETLTRLISLCKEEHIQWADSLPISSTPPWVYTREDVFSYGATNEDGSFSRRPTLFGSLCQRMKWISDPAGPSLTAEELMTAMGKSLLGTESAPTCETREILGVLYELYLRTYQITYNEYTFAQNIGISFITKVKEQNLPGVEIVAVSSRRYNTDCAPHVLGRVGQLSPEEWPIYRELGYPMDAYVGKDGIERAFEEYLHGSNGIRRTEIDQSGNIVSEVWSVEPQPGSNVVLTLDQSLQTVTEDLLSQFISTLDEPAGAAAVMVDMSGGVLALASYPDYDLSTFHENYTQLAGDPNRPLYNRATQGLYAPGSTFKPLTAIAALSTGVIDTKSTVYCGGVYTHYSDVQPRCWAAAYGRYHGTETVSQAITDSCNIFFYDVGRRTGIQTLVEYAAQFGLGQPTGIEVPEKVGHVAGPETSKELGQVWYGGNTMYAAIGQENNQLTPLQLANYIATLVNGGRHYRAHLLKEIRSADDSEILVTCAPEIINTVEMEPTALEAVKKGMYDLSKISSMNRYFSTLPVEVGCKTGTAEVLGATSNAIFVCFAPFDDPQVALCIVVEKGASGGSLASIASGMLREFFAADP